MQDIIINNSTLSQPKDNSELLKEALREELELLWEKDIYRFVAKNYINTIKEAMASDVKWNLQIDYSTRLRANEWLHKIINPKLWQKSINIGLFTPPPTGKPLWF